MAKVKTANSSQQAITSVFVVIAFALVVLPAEGDTAREYDLQAMKLPVDLESLALLHCMCCRHPCSVVSDQMQYQQ
jgi:hypothetical protein